MARARLRAGDRWALVVALIAASLFLVPAVREPARADVPPPAGPELLHLPPPAAPQLQNTLPWKAQPILVGGASSYRAGEFLYQDFLYDDFGAGSASTYPTDPDYAGNAADFVELRIKRVGAATKFRITYNSMIDPALVATTIALGDSGAPVAMPHGANTLSPGQRFVTVHGTTADVVDGLTGAPVVGAAPAVTVDRTARQVTVTVPFSTFDPRDGTAVRVAAATGLWDAAAGRYLVPQVQADATHPGGGNGMSTSAFFNVAFRYDEPIGGGGKGSREAQQSAALGRGDISPFFALVDFVKLASKVTDDMSGQRGGVPVTGFMNRIYASRYETKQGRGSATSLQTQNCPQPCAPAKSGQLQSYSLYVPAKPVPAAGFGLTLMLHGSGGTQNGYQSGTGALSFGDRGAGSVVLMPEGRGPAHWWYGQAAADVFEGWADVDRHYALDLTRTVLAGGSMGGYGAYKLGAMYPDLFASIVPVIPCGSAGGPYIPGTPPPGGQASAIATVAPSLRHVPALTLMSANDELCTYLGDWGSREIYAKLSALNYPYKQLTFYGPEHSLVGSILQYNADQLVDWTEGRRIDPNPAHVTYVFDDEMSQPEAGVTSDHAYWVSGLRLRNQAPLPTGTVDAFSYGVGTTDPPPTPVTYGQGVYATNHPFVYTSSGREVVGGTAPRQDRLDLTVKNLAAVTIDPVRAGLSCAAALHVSSDGPVTVTFAGCPDRTPETFGALVPTQLVAKGYTETLGRAPTQAEWTAAVDGFASTGCTAASVGDFVTQKLLSSEYAGLGYDSASRVLTLFRSALNRDPTAQELASFTDLLEGGAAWSSVIASAFALPEFEAELLPAICGPRSDYGFGTIPAPSLPTTGTGFAGGTGAQLQALLNATPSGGTVWLAQKAVVRVEEAPVVVPAGVTLATVGLPGRHRYAALGRVVRAGWFRGAVLKVTATGRLESLWVDGQQGTPFRVASNGVGTPSDQLLADNDIGLGSYTTTAQAKPGLRTLENIELVGGDIIDSLISATSGWTTVKTGNVNGTECFAKISGNLVTAYPSHHDSVFADGFSNYCGTALIENNEVVDASDVPIISFPTASAFPQRSEVRNNTILSAGNSAYAAMAFEPGVPAANPPSFEGANFHHNVMWSGSRTHFDIGISLGARPWRGTGAATGQGGTFADNTTGALSARVRSGIAVSGMLGVKVQRNVLTTTFVPTTEGTACPFVTVGADITGGNASAADDIQQPYQDVSFDNCIAAGEK